MIGTVNRNLLHRLGDAWQAWKSSPPAASLYSMPYSSSPTQWISWQGWAEYERQAGGRDEANAKVAINSPWVFRTVNAIAKELSVATLEVKQRAGDEGDEDIENHPLEKLWENPNPFMGRAWLMQWWCWQLLLFGEAYLYTVPGPDGTPAELWPLPSTYLTPIPDEKRFIKGYLWRRPGSDDKGIVIDTKPIVYSRLPNPFDIRRGLSPLCSILVDVQGDIAMAKWNANFFAKENATPTGVIAVPKDTLDTDIVRIRSEIQDFFGGSTRRVAVARAGDLAWTPFDRSQKDMDFLNARTFTRDMIGSVFGLPEGFFSKDATRANSEGAKATMIENAVWPHLVMLAEDLNAQLLPLYYEEGLRAEFADIRPRNKALELQELTTYQGFLTVDELRAKIDTDPLGDPRGLMLVAEIAKGTPIPATEASLQTEEVISQMEADAADEAPEEEGAEASPLDATTPPEEEGGTIPEEAMTKADDLDRWERKALKNLKRFHTASVRFESSAIPAAEQAAIKAALLQAETPADVRAAFKVGEDVDQLIDAEWSGAMAWAKKVRE